MEQGRKHEARIGREMFLNHRALIKTGFRSGGAKLGMAGGGKKESF